jgi:hypothetical protein
MHDHRIAQLPYAAIYLSDDPYREVSRQRYLNDYVLNSDLAPCQYVVPYGNFGFMIVAHDPDSMYQDVITFLKDNHPDLIGDFSPDDGCHIQEAEMVIQPMPSIIECKDHALMIPASYAHQELGLPYGLYIIPHLFSDVQTILEHPESCVYVMHDNAPPSESVSQPFVASIDPQLAMIIKGLGISGHLITIAS